MCCLYVSTCAADRLQAKRSKSMRMIKARIIIFEAYMDVIRYV